MNVKLKFDEERFQQTLEKAEQEFFKTFIKQYNLGCKDLGPLETFRFATAAKCAAREFLRANYVVKC